MQAAELRRLIVRHRHVAPMLSGTIAPEPIGFLASDLRLISGIASLAAPTFDQAAVHQAALHAPGPTG